MAWKHRQACLEHPVLAAQSLQGALGVLNTHKITVGALANVPDLWHFLNRGSEELAGLAVRTSRLFHTVDVGTVTICRGT